MFVAARNRNLSHIGFSEHSPRPKGFNYIHEYRDQLAAFLPTYVSEVTALKNESDCEVLLGLEMDWLSGEEAFIRKSISNYDYDYIIGSVHFLEHWGFDDGVGPWVDVSQEICEQRYCQYFESWHEMISSGLFQIAAHPDLIKIFSSDKFSLWLNKAESKSLIWACLNTLKASGMAMEISSAGLRKACRQIYPHPVIMEMASRLDIPITFASDAHCMGDIAKNFTKLAEYARRFGYCQQALFNHGHKSFIPF